MAWSDPTRTDGGRDPGGGLRRGLVLPDAWRHPACRCETLVGVAVACLVTLDLLRPISGV